MIVDTNGDFGSWENFVEVGCLAVESPAVEFKSTIACSVENSLNVASWPPRACVLTTSMCGRPVVVQVSI